jgi:predicted dehydrogenase
MALDMTPEQKEIGKANFERVVGGLANSAEDAKKANQPNRREFMKGLIAAGAVVPVSAAAYYGYSHSQLDGKPIKVGLIGAGDQGGVLVGAHNPLFTEIVAVADIRPYNQDRIIRGEQKGPRLGLERIYGKDARKSIKVTDNYKDILENKDIEAVIIALPLHLHAPVAIEAMKAGKHVLCEKLMAWNIRQCKEMIQAADETKKILSIGHQRHYSLLYAHCVEVLRSGVLGNVNHIRALWHRNNSLPFNAGDPSFLLYPPATDTKKYPQPEWKDGWKPALRQMDVEEALEDKLSKYAGDYKSLEELVRWRLFNRTGGGLMAELGSHQLDACSIFIGRGIHGRDEAVHPLAVSGVGYKLFYRDGREVDDSVFVTFEFPGKGYFADTEKHTAVKDADDRIIVTYSSVNTNAFEPYGECVMGSHGSLVTLMEQEVMLYPEGGRSTAVGVKAGGGAALDTSASSGPVAAKASATGAAALGSGGPVSRGYREEMEHWATCIRLQGQGMDGQDPKPRCEGRVAMADAIIALTSNIAMKQQKRIEFDPKWFKADKSEGYNLDDVPEKLAKG